MVVCDYSMRFYIVAHNSYGVVKLIERGDAGPDLLRRKSNERECIGMRSIDEENFEKLFSVVSNISAARVARKWLEANHWPMTQEVKAVIDHILYLDDMFAFLAYRASHRNAEKVLDRARKIKERYQTEDTGKFSFSRRVKC